jgi:LacI family transcriptional regulator, galactose operon repressor
MPTTLEDIARALKVSKMTVSRAINNHPEISRQTRERILAVAQKMNYRPNQFARALTTNRSYLIGIVVPDLMHSYFAEICRGVELRARPSGYQNLICSTDEDPRKEIAEIEALLSRTDGLIVASAISERETKFYRQLIRDGGRIVLIDRLLEGLKVSAVITDDVQVGILATRHLLKLGHRRIGHLRGTIASTSRQRFDGFISAMAEAGLRVPAEAIRDCGFTEDDGYRAMKSWIADGELPSAIFAANDPAAIGAMTALHAAAIRVPDDIAIVGAGRIHYGDMLRVPLTTVTWSTLEMGQEAASLLLDSITGRSKTTRQVVVKPELVIRESCGGRGQER